MVEDEIIFTEMENLLHRLIVRVGFLILVLFLLFYEIAIESALQCINQTENIGIAKEIFCQNHRDFSCDKWNKLLWKLKQFGINPLTFSDTAENLPKVLKNPCSLLTEYLHQIE